jgi:hypothetical protein
MPGPLYLLLTLAILAAVKYVSAQETVHPSPPSLESQASEWTRGVSFADLPAQADAVAVPSPFQNLSRPPQWSTSLKAGACVAASILSSTTNGTSKTNACDDRELDTRSNTRLKSTPDKHP